MRSRTYVAPLVACVVALSGCAAAEDPPASHPVQTDVAETPDAQPTEAEFDSMSPCVLTADEVGALIIPAAGLGEVTFGGEDAEVRNYNLLAATLDGGGNGTALNGGSGPSFQFRLHRYSDNYEVTRGVFDVSRTFGGQSPQQVYDTAVIAVRDVAAATLFGDGLGDYPDIGAGLVTDRFSSFTLAGSGEYWLQGSFGGMKGGAALEDTLVRIATMAADRL